MGASFKGNRMSFKLFISDNKYSELEDILKPIQESLSMTLFKLSEHKVDDILVVIGGDGTLNYLAQLEFKNTPQVIYFPEGTANDFAKTLNCTHSHLSTEVLKDIKRHAKSIDVPLMKCNEKYFINVATGGAPATITNAGSDMLKKVTGKISYYLSAIDQFMTPHVYQVSYKLDEVKSEGPIYGFTVAQGLYAGGGVKVSSGTTGMFQDEFSVVLAPAGSMKNSISDIIELQNYKSNNYASFKVMHTDKFSIKSLDNSPIALKLDGEEYENTQLEFSKTEKKISFYIY